ncbi:MAG: hypothetical protein D6761_13555 [Candidatus Dadabacteria bacterium]|nr:MAG: hypothetical protein D6761_13555 [Candidatus Dadabacteria bacterium]
MASHTRTWIPVLSALFLGAVVVNGCGSDGNSTPVKNTYIVSEDQILGSLGLLGQTIGAIAQSSIFPSSISASEFPTPCLLGPGTPETDATVVTTQACSHVDTGVTSCQMKVDFSACTLLDGAVRHAPAVFTAGQGVTTTIWFDDFAQGNTAAGTSRIQFGGMVRVTTATDSLIFEEHETVTASSADDPEGTALNVTSRYTVRVFADKGTMVVDGSGNYEVSGIGGNSVTVSGLTFELASDGCSGPTAGLLSAVNPIEGFQVAYSACNDLEIRRLKNGVVIDADTVHYGPETSQATGIFELAIDSIRAVALTLQNAQPADTKLYDATKQVTAAAAPDLWCRFFDPTKDGPLVGTMKATPSATSQGVAECLMFPGMLTSPTGVTTERTLVAGVISLEGPLTDTASLKLLGADVGSPMVAADSSGVVTQFTAVTLTTIDPASTPTRAAFEQQGGAAISNYPASLTLSPTAEPGAIVLTAAGNTPVPNWRCVQNKASESAISASWADPVTAGTPDAQCVPQVSTFSLDWTRLGVWLLGSDGSAGLYTRVIE